MITQRIPHVILLHIYVLLEYNCFTVLVVLLYKVNQLNVYIYPLPLELSISPSHPFRSSQHQAEVPVIYNSFPLAIYFTHGSVYVKSLTSYLCLYHCWAREKHGDFLNEVIIAI